jgi:hypothetical protein
MTMPRLLYHFPMERLLLLPPSGVSLPSTAARLALLLRRFAYTPCGQWLVYSSCGCNAR